MKKGDVLTSKRGHTAKVTKVTTKVIIVEVERRVVNRRTGELTTEKRIREIPVERWVHFERAYRET